MISDPLAMIDPAEAVTEFWKNCHTRYPAKKNTVKLPLPNGMRRKVAKTTVKTAAMSRGVTRDQANPSADPL